MHAVCLHQHGDIHVVVDDKAGPGLPGQPPQQAAFLQHGTGFQFFFAILQNAHACPHKGGNNFFKRPSQ
jgi:hypothetical protein